MHKITYIVYLTPNFKAMRFAKNCGEFMLDQSFPKELIQVYDLSFDLSLNDLSNHFGKLSINLRQL